MSRDKRFKEWADHVRKNMVPQMAGSAYVVSIAPPFNANDFDVKAAVEIGACILMGKPLIVLKARGRTAAPTLLRIADKVIEFTEGDKADFDRACTEMGEYMNQ